MQKSVIIILGPPGAGKGTQSELLSEKLNLYYLETSKIIETFIKSSKEKDFVVVDGKKYYFKEQKKLWETGKLCSPPFVTYLLTKKIKELSSRKESLVLGGSPRTLFEGKKIIPLLEKLYGKENIKVVLIKLSAEESIFRNSHRRICSLLRHPILYNKETKNLTMCPLDGSKLKKRKKLDDPETIKVRLKEYKERTLPLMNYFKKEGIEVKEINGEQSVADVFGDVLKVISQNDSH